ncbi:MAG: alpha/beta hydrolase family protein, partial [Planctomycetota bacterium JB042]
WRCYGARWSMTPFASLLSRAGVAAILFDGRGRGDSTGDPLTTTAADRVADARAAFACLAAREDVDAGRIGYLGESTGGWIAPLAADGRDVRFLVHVVGPAEDVPSQQGHVVQGMMRRSGEEFSDEELAAAFAYQSDLCRHLAAGGTFDAFADRIAAARATRWGRFADTPDDFDVPGLQFLKHQSYDPTDALRRLRAPLLAIFGGDDFVVPPELNVPKLEALLAEAGVAFEVVVVDGANHDVYRAEPDSPWPFPRPPPSYHAKLVEWVRTHSGLAPE